MTVFFLLLPQVTRVWLYGKEFHKSLPQYSHVREMQSISAPLEADRFFVKTQHFHERAFQPDLNLSVLSSTMWNSINNTKVLYSKTSSCSRINSYSRALLLIAGHSDGTHTTWKSYPLLALLNANHKCTKVRSRRKEVAEHVNLIPWTSVHFLKIGFWCNWVVLNSTIIPIKYNLKTEKRGKVPFISQLHEDIFGQVMMT